MRDCATQQHRQGEKEEDEENEDVKSANVVF
jgi:hypothetical protein